MSLQPHQIVRHLAVGLVLAATACGPDAVIVPSDEPLSPTGAAKPVGVDTTMSSAVAGIRFAAPVLVVPLHARTRLPVVPVNAQGYPSLALLARQPVIRSANPAILSVDTAGVVTGVALGTVRVYATLDAWTDSALVTVAAATDSVPVPTPAPTPVPTPTPVPVFQLTTTVVALGPASPRDTIRPSVPVAAAQVRVYHLVRDSSGARDSLRVGPLAASASTGADGRAVFRDLPSGLYSVQADGPAGQGYGGARLDFGPPTVADYRVTLVLRGP